MHELESGDETRVAGIAAEMFFEREFLLPRLNGTPFLEYPPGCYWIIAGAYLLLGISDFAAKLPSCLAAFSMVRTAHQNLFRNSGDFKTGNLTFRVPFHFKCVTETAALAGKRILIGFPRIANRLEHLRWIQCLERSVPFLRHIYDHIMRVQLRIKHPAAANRSSSRIPISTAFRCASTRRESNNGITETDFWAEHWKS